MYKSHDASDWVFTISRAQGLAKADPVAQPTSCSSRRRARIVVLITSDQIVPHFAIGPNGPRIYIRKTEGKKARAYDHKLELPSNSIPRKFYPTEVLFHCCIANHSPNGTTRTRESKMIDNHETSEVVICGCGPTGAMLSCLLGRMGVKNIIIDQEEGITTDPRGIALDEDGIRALQSVGLYDDIYSKIGRCMGVFNFIGGVHSRLDKAPFTRMDYRTSEGGTGHVGFICHKQPGLEQSLRNAISDLSSCDLRTQCTMTRIDEDANRVIVTYRDKDGLEHKVRAKFLVGADGKTGYTRKNYLEKKGIIMQRSSK
jgi:hypothetical protein